MGILKTYRVVRANATPTHIRREVIKVGLDCFAAEELANEKRQEQGQPWAAYLVEEESEHDVLERNYAKLHTALSRILAKASVAKEAAEAGNDGVMSSIYNIANNALEDIK